MHIGNRLHHQRYFLNQTSGINLLEILWWCFFLIQTKNACIYYRKDRLHHQRYFLNQTSEINLLETPGWWFFLIQTKNACIHACIYYRKDRQRHERFFFDIEWHTSRWQSVLEPNGHSFSPSLPLFFFFLSISLHTLRCIIVTAASLTEMPT